MLCFFTASTPLRAQLLSLSPDLRFDNYNAQNSFVSTNIERVIRSSKGYVWGIGNGIYRFDGIQTTHFSKLNTANRGLRDNRLADLTEDAYGRIWFVGKGGICYYDDVTDTFKYLDIDSETKIQNGFGLCRVGNILWFCTEHGLCRLNTQTLKVDTTTLKFFPCVLVHAADSNTLVLTARNGPYYIYKIRENTFEKKELPSSQNATIWSIAQYNSELWMSNGEGLWMTNNVNVQPQKVAGTENMICGIAAFVPALTGDSILWIGTKDGILTLFNKHTHKTMYTYAPNPNNPYSFLGQFIRYIHVDKEHIIWFSTEKGICAMNYRNQFFKTQRLPDNVIFRIAQDSGYKSTVWMSGFEQGLSKINWDNKQVIGNHFQFKSCGDAPGYGSSIMNMYQLDRDNWLLSSYNVLFTWNAKTQKERIISDLPARYFIDYKRDTLVIVSSDTIYMCQLPSCKTTAVSAAKGMNDGTYDGRKYLWIPTTHGLLRYDPSDGTKTFFRVDTSIDNGRANIMLKAAMDRKGRIICGTRSGVAIFDTTTRLFHFYGNPGGLVHPDCYDIKLKDSLAFINTNGGHVCLNLNTGRAFIVALRDKGNFSDRPIGSVNDEIVLGLAYEYAYFDPAHILQQPIPSAPLIEKIKIDNQAIYYPADMPVLSLKYFQNQIAFYFTAFEYQNPGNIQFRYMIDGLDTTWSYTGTLREVHYMRIPPGSYTFRVQSGNGKGEWNQQPATLRFKIATPYWKTWWFRVLAVLIVSGLLFALYKYRVNYIRQIERIRRKIAADFHDDLGSTLSSISIYSEVARKSSEINLPRTNQLLEEIGEKTRSIIVSMNDMIWSVKPENDTLKKLTEHMQEFGLPMAEARDILLVFSIPQSLMDLKLDMASRKNLYYIYKEALNNAIKYSGATTITISFEKHRAGYVMNITDNGKGFDINSRVRGNGISNMAKRAQEMSGKMELVSKPGEGTSIRCLVKIT